MTGETTRLLAERIKRQTRDAGVIELCDAVLAADRGCVVCEARRAAKAASQRKWRAGRRA